MSSDEAAARFARLRDFLVVDPTNVRLAIDCAEAALAANLADEASAVLAPFVEQGVLDDAALNLAGIAALRNGDQAAAQTLFAQLAERHPADTGLRFNMAWSRALQGDFAGAIDTLDEDTTAALPQAAMLDLQMRHEVGDFDGAEARLESYIERYPDYAPLQAAASVLAMDVDRPDIARQCAERGGDNPDALATLGTLSLGDDQHEAARILFERSILEREKNPRAHLGLGLTMLASGDAKGALPHLDRGAEQFGDHLGSWLASGWAHLLAGETEAARARFERALAEDDTFGEAQGSLAVMDALAGEFDAARRRAEVAVRLDRQSFSAALAGIILASADGDQERAQRIFETAARQPLSHDGRTLAEMLAKTSI